MAPPFALPEDVVEFVNKVLGRCNTRIASRLSRLPTIHEQQTFGRPQLTGRGTMPQATVTCEKLSAGLVARPVPDLDAGLIRVFSQRGAPISAALRIDINAP